MWMDILDWSLRVAILLVNTWLFVAIVRSGEVTKIYLFVMMYFLILNDCLAYLINIFHDIPSFFQSDSILANRPFLYGIAVAFLCCQWFFHLFFLPVFSLLHFTALFFPFLFKRFNMRWMLFIIFLLYCLTAIVTIPLFTACCGFIYHADFKYWFFDYNKPYTGLYQFANNLLQVFCVAIMALCNLAIFIKLNLLRRKNVSFRQTSFVVSVQTEATATGTTRSDQPHRQTRTRRTAMGPEVRLAISFMMLSGCFFCSTLAFNYLMGTTSVFLKVLDLLAGYLNNSKWIIYCLANRHIRKTFISPRKIFGC